MHVQGFYNWDNDRHPKLKHAEHSPHGTGSFNRHLRKKKLSLKVQSFYEASAGMKDKVPTNPSPMVAAGPCKSGVLGSIPGLATYFRFFFCFFKKGSCQLLAKVCA